MVHPTLPILLTIVIMGRGCYSFGRSRDTVGTKNERQDRLSVVLGDPIVELAQDIFKSLLDFDKMNYDGKTTNQINETEGKPDISQESGENCHSTLGWLSLQYNFALNCNSHYVSFFSNSFYTSLFIWSIPIHHHLKYLDKLK